MRHMDEARKAALKVLREEIRAGGADGANRTVLVEDLFGRLRLVVFSQGTNGGGSGVEGIEAGLRLVASPYWTGETLVASAGRTADLALAERAWKEGLPDEELPDRLRVLDRHRNRGWWFETGTQPPWGAPSKDRPAPPILSFYSFKGGVGRTTALAAFAIQRARAGESVVVVDADLDAPGVGQLLSNEEPDSIPPWGLADFLLERRLGPVDLGDYFYSCRSEAIVGRGSISVVPTGRLDEGYLGKLARLDLEPAQQGDGGETLVQLLTQLRDERQPDWILLDSRAGLADPAGALLGGLAHLNVLFGTSGESSWAGLRIVLGRLGRERVRRGLPQADCVLVHGMVSAEVSEEARAEFKGRSLDEFEEVFYAADPDDEEERSTDVWYVGDAESGDAPHVPVPIHYNHRLAFFSRLEAVADLLAGEPDYVALTQRVAARFRREEP